jgi:NADH:ubiquinone oxidoreductase subunit 2 (subunit N)
VVRQDPIRGRCRVNDGGHAAPAGVAGMTLVIFRPFSREHGFALDEFPALVLFAAAGMIMVVHGA